MRKPSRITRRRALVLSAAATALPLVHIRTAGAAGKLAVGFWDHWVPSGNDIMQKQVDAWAAKNKVDVHVDFITGNGNKLLMTGAAEAQAKTGHDMFTFYNWDVYNQHEALAPVDDIMKHLTGKYGAASATAEYLAKVKGHWIAVPTSSGTQTKPPCARISWFKKHGLDVQAMYPVKPEHTAMQDAWTWDALAKYAELAKKEGMTFGLGMGGNTNTDAIDTHGALFRSFGAALIDKEGAIQLKSDAVRQVLEFSQRLVKSYPDDAVSYDDASNNRALISGKSALIFNPPSAWAVAKRDAPTVAADSWTFSAPAGPKGRFVPTATFFWGVWSFSPNQSAAKELLTYLMERDQVEARSNAVDGYDIPPYAGMLDFKIWETVEPPPGTVYNYPIRPWHNAQPSLTASEAPPDIAVQIYQRAIHNQMLARLKDNQSIPQVIAWAQEELEGFTR
jgi:ABC-type glycerol-3-phosphate transport system substrate-binding protein